ncbi:MAG: NAD-binding protein [Candidatus Cloacimonetes bacterium]|nr:NAD-binding protein [Candidatus Cloacimonadota bacterium]
MKNSFLKRIGYLIGLIVLLIGISSTVVLEFERQNSASTIQNYGDSLWWSLVTVTTIGYGDMVPITPGGRGVGVVLIIFGFSSLTILTALLASIFVEDKLKGAKGLKRVKQNGHLVICGWNSSAEYMLKSLQDRKGFNKSIVLVGNYSVENFEGIQSRFANLNLLFVRGDQTQIEILKRANINNADKVFVLTDESNARDMADDYTIVVVNTIKYISSDADITVQLINASKKHLLKRYGVEEILVFDELSGYMLASDPEGDYAVSIYEKLLKDKDHNMRLIDIPESMVGKSFEEFFMFAWRELNCIPVGLIDSQKSLKIEDIFSDDSSAIDNYIKTTLVKAKSMNTDKNEMITLHPEKSFQIRANQKALVI